MARNFGIPPRGSLPAPRIDPKRLRQIEAALSTENQERSFRIAEALQHVTSPWASDERKLVEAMWSRKDRNWHKLVAVQLGIVAALFLALLLVMR